MKRSHNINDFKEGVKRESEELVLKKFPKKVQGLEQLLEDERFRLQSIDLQGQINIPFMDSNESLDRQRPKKKPKIFEHIPEEDQAKDQLNIEVGVIQQNKCLEEKVSIIRPLLQEFTDDTLSLKVGISLMKPKIEDGNNFGVEIQEEALELIYSIEEDVYSRLKSISNYYVSRAELVTKLIKNPSIEDYRNAIKERDEVFNAFLCVSLILVRNYYANIHDFVAKNLNKIKKPKTEGNEDMLY